MLYRALDSNGDYQLGSFLKNSPATVGQAVLTRLLLWYGEWFLDITDGTPWSQDVLGFNTSYDLEIQSRILETPGVLTITEYTSQISAARNLSVSCTVNTVYGVTTITI